MTSTPSEDIKAAVRVGVEAAAASGTNDLDRKDVSSVTAKVASEVVPVVLHATNNEPWYRSRVTWGALGSIVLPLLGFIGVSSDIVTLDEFVAGGLAVGTMISGAITLYGRWKAKRPIGA